MTLPSAPSSTNPTTFQAEADAFVAALPQFETDMNALAAAFNFNSINDTSSSSVAIGLGSKSFTVSASKSFWPGMFLVIADSAAPTTNYMVSQVSSYSGTTLQVSSVVAVGSGTKTSWNISIAANPAINLTGNQKTVVHTGNGHGSTNTKIRRFTTTITDTLGAYADSAANGATFTIPTSGIYSVHYSDDEGTAAPYGISVDSAELTTSFLTITESTKLFVAGNADGGGGVATYLTASSVLRCHTDGSMTDNANARLTLERLF